MRRASLFFLSAILLLAFFLGARMILSGDFYYLFDQARDYLLVKNIIDTRDIVLIGTHSGLGGFFHGPLWLYMLTPVYLLGRGDPLVFSYFYVILQLITIVAAFVCGSKLYGEKGGLLIALLIALSPVTWSVVQNTIGVNVLPLVFIGLFYFLIKFIRGNTNAFIFVSFFTGLALQFEAALPLVLIPVVTIIFFVNKKAVKNVKVIALSIASFILSISTFVLFDLRHQFLMTEAILGAFGQSQKGKGYLEWNERLYEHFQSLIATYKSVLFRESTVSTILFVVILLFGTILILKSKKNKYKKEFLFLLVFPLLVFGVFIFYPYKIWPEYVFGLVVPTAIVFYLSIISIWKNIFGKIVTILFFTVTFFNVFSAINTQYFQKYPENNSSGSYQNQKKVVEWIFNDKKEGKFGYFVYTPEIYTHGADYLISHFGKNYPRVSAQNTKQKTTYLILYPHLADDEKAHEFWKKNVVRTTGKIIKTKKFSGNIIVEKLSIDDKEQSADPNYYQGLIFR